MAELQEVAVEPVVDSTRSTDSPVRRTYTQTNWTKRRKTDGDRVHPVLRTRLFRWYHAFEQHPVGVVVNTLSILIGIAVYEYFSLVPALTLDPSEATGLLARKTVPLDVNFILPRVLLDVTLVLMGLCTVLALRTINKPGGALDALGKVLILKNRERWAAGLQLFFALLYVTGVVMFMVLAIGEIIGPSFPYRLGGGVPTATTIAMASLAVAFCPFTLGVVYAFLLTLGVAMTCAWTALYDFKQRVKETDPRDAAAWEATVVPSAQTLAWEVMPQVNKGWSLVISLFVTFCFFYLIAELLNPPDMLLEETFNRDVQSSGEFRGNMIIGVAICLLLVLCVPARISMGCSGCTSALKRRHLEMLGDDAAHPGRAEAVRGLVWALQSTSQFGFNVLGVKLTPRLLGGCLSALAALFGILVSRQSDLDDAAGVDWAVVCANLNVSVSVKA